MPPDAWKGLDCIRGADTALPALAKGLGPDDMLDDTDIPEETFVVIPDDIPNPLLLWLEELNTDP